MRRAFTLIEMIVALALGMVVLYTATAGFRAAAKATTKANQLSLENALMREGLHRAHDELDFWTDYDDPSDPAHQALRPLFQDQAASGNQWRGQAFTPLRDLHAHGVFARGGMVGDETARGWDPANDTWQPHDPRTWFRGNLAEKATRPENNRNGTIALPEGDLRFGRYALFSAISANLGDADLSHDGNAHFDKGPFLSERSTAPYPGSAAVPPYGAVAVPHTWYPNQVAGTMDALGFYGALDYLPANTIWAYYQPYVHWHGGGFYDDATSLGGWPLWMVHLSGGYGAQFMFSDLHFVDRSHVHGDTIGSGSNLPRSALDASSGGTYLMPNPLAPLPAGFTIPPVLYRYRISRYEFSVNIAATGAQNLGQVEQAIAASAQFIPLLPQRPTRWPAVDVTVSHLFINGRWTNVCRVQRLSPGSGEVAELSFTGIGSTLRGARGQRARGGGWAAWDNAAGFDPAAHPTLDSY